MLTAALIAVFYAAVALIGVAAAVAFILGLIIGDRFGG